MAVGHLRTDGPRVRQPAVLARRRAVPALPHAPFSTPLARPGTLQRVDGPLAATNDLPRPISRRGSSDAGVACALEVLGCGTARAPRCAVPAPRAGGQFHGNHHAPRFHRSPMPGMWREPMNQWYQSHFTGLFTEFGRMEPRAHDPAVHICA